MQSQTENENEGNDIYEIWLSEGVSNSTLLIAVRVFRRVCVFRSKSFIEIHRFEFSGRSILLYIVALIAEIPTYKYKVNISNWTVLVAKTEHWTVLVAKNRALDSAGREKQSTQCWSRKRKGERRKKEKTESLVLIETVKEKRRKKEERRKKKEERKKK